MLNLVTVCDYIGTFAFAISGIRLAAAKKFDWFGAYVIGLVTAVGGGTIRDLLLHLNPFWMLQPSYVIITFVALIFVVIFKKYLVRINNTVFLFDAIGLGLFVVVGVDKTLMLGYPYWVAIIMGTITGSFGGLLRDILINEMPLIFRKDIYAFACILGGLVYTLFLHLHMALGISQLISALSVILCRVLCVHYNVSLPTLRGED